MIVKLSRIIKKLKTGKKRPKQEKVYDIGLSILRPFFAYIVIMTHCYNYNYLSKKWKVIYQKSERFFFPVRVLFIMSFYFSYKTIISSDYKKKYDRFIRLFIPYFIWPTIFYFLDKILKRFIFFGGLITIKSLIKQYLIGAPVIGPLWYHTIMILYYILLNINVIIFKNSYNFIAIIISIVAFIVQYNGINQKFIKKYDIDYKRTYGRIAEIAPSILIGFLIASSGLMNFFRKYKLRVFVICTLINYFLIKYDIFIQNTGTDYAGVKSYLISIVIFIGFSVFPSEKVKNKIIIKIIKILTNYTAGVYYLHLPLSRYLKSKIISIKKRTFKGCGLLYILSYLICFFGDLILGRTRLKNLFV